jgi:hypothetical protein
MAWDGVPKHSPGFRGSGSPSSNDSQRSSPIALHGEHRASVRGAQDSHDELKHPTELRSPVNDPRARMRISAYGGNPRRNEPVSHSDPSRRAGATLRGLAGDGDAGAEKEA